MAKSYVTQFAENVNNSRKNMIGIYKNKKIPATSTDTLDVLINRLNNIYLFYIFSLAFTTTLFLLSFVHVIIVSSFFPPVNCVVSDVSLGSTVCIS